MLVEFKIPSKSGNMQSDNNASCTTEDEMVYQRIGKLTIGKLRASPYI